MIEESQPQTPKQIGSQVLMLSSFGMLPQTHSQGMSGDSVTYWQHYYNTLMDCPANRCAFDDFDDVDVEHTCHNILRNQFTGDASFYPPLRKKGRSERSVTLHRLIVMPENSIEVPCSISASVLFETGGSVEADSEGIEIAPDELEKRLKEHLLNWSELNHFSF